MLKNLNKIMQAGTNVMLNINHHQHIHEALIERCWLVYMILGKAGYIPAEISRRADVSPLLINLSFPPKRSLHPYVASKIKQQARYISRASIDKLIKSHSLMPDGCPARIHHTRMSDTSVYLC